MGKFGPISGPVQTEFSSGVTITGGIFSLTFSNENNKCQTTAKNDN